MVIARYTSLLARQSLWLTGLAALSLGVVSTAEAYQQTGPRATGPISLSCSATGGEIYTIVFDAARKRGEIRWAGRAHPFESVSSANMIVFMFNGDGADGKYVLTLRRDSLRLSGSHQPGGGSAPISISGLCAAPAGMAL